MTKQMSKIEQLFIQAMSEEAWHNIQEMEAGQNEHGFDVFGFEPSFLKYILPISEWIYRKYFRAEIFDIDNIPNTGPVLLIANHSGQIPLDGLMIGSACLLDKKPPRMIRSMVERWVPSLPIVSWFFARAGQVPGTRENARILLDQGGCLLVFPEGVRGISKTYDKAYQLQEFGLGFMRLALETNTPIVPVGVIGAEEQMPAFFNLDRLAKLFGAPAFPITPTWPLLGPLGALPLPVKYRIYFGEPMTFSGQPDDEDRLVHAQVQEVKDAIDSLLKRGLAQRDGIFT